MTMQYSRQFDDLASKIIGMFEFNEDEPDFIRSLINRYPRVFYRIIKMHQAGKLREPRFIHLPKQQGRLKFVSEVQKIRIVFLHPKDINFSEKFTIMMDEIRVEMENEPAVALSARKSLLDCAFDSAVIREIESSLSSLY